eukprot:1049455-Rhodomonas_salina.2
MRGTDVLVLAYQIPGTDVAYARYRGSMWQAVTQGVLGPTGSRYHGQHPPRRPDTQPRQPEPPVLTARAGANERGCSVLLSN